MIGISDTGDTFSISSFNDVLGDVVEVLSNPNLNTFTTLVYDLDSVVDVET